MPEADARAPEPTYRAWQERSSAPRIDLAGQVLPAGPEPVYVSASERP